MGAIPSGFRESTLAHLLSENCNVHHWMQRCNCYTQFSTVADYHTSSWLVPSLSPTFMSLVDLSWDHSKNKVGIIS